MKRSILSWASALVIASGLVLQARAGSIINNFDTGSYNYVLNGIIGDTNWDGVYLNFGDIPGGNNGGDGVGHTTVANSTDNPGYLTVTGTGTSWAGAGDDGFFLYKVVSGDFDASVEIYYPFNAAGFHLPGLLVRSWNTNLSGAPFAPTGANPALENWMYNTRFQEFNQSAHGRYVTNGADHDGFFSTRGTNNDLNTPRYLRITRVGDLFSFFEKTNQADPWGAITNLNRGDLTGLPVQVGIEDNVGTTASPTVYFTDFELSGPSVSWGTPNLPSTPSNIITTDTNIGGSLTFSWTVGTPGDSSLVVMRRNGNIQVNPVQGLTYIANSSFGVSNALMGGGQSVVYSGTGNSVTVTNLAANNVNYTVAVYEYTNNGTTTIYNTLTPTTAVFPGPGLITGAFLAAASTNVLVGGATDVKLIATFSTGETLDQTASTAWASSDPSIANIDGVSGAITGLAPGTTTITGTFGTNTPTIVINVSGAPFAFTDNFTRTNDYFANGILGSVYDGLYMNFGDVPGTINAGADGNGFTVTMNSQITTTNGLYMSSVQCDWEAANDDGPFLFKNVPGTNYAVSGDFEAVVHINNMNILNGSLAGMMARLYTSPDHSRGPNRENHVNYWKVQNGTTSARVTSVAVNTTLFGAGPSAADGWLMIQRANSTNFYFYERPTTNDMWVLTTSTTLLNASNNAPMEVGIAEQSTLGVNSVATFDSFSLDAVGIASATPIPSTSATNLTMTLNGDLSMTLNWVSADGSGNPVPSIVVMRQGFPVSAQPPVGATLTGNSVFKSGSNLGGGNYVVFVSANPPASTNNTVTVTGLTSAQTYYATVYTYAGTGLTRVINPAGITGNLIDAAITNVVASVVGGAVPKGGISAFSVLGVTATGQYIPISTAGAVYTTDNTNILQVLGTVLTGTGIGTANLTVALGGFTNSIAVTVRPAGFAENFDAEHDYLVDGVTNTAWDGLYNPSATAGNPIPGSTYVPLANSGTVFASSPVTNVVITGTNVVAGVTNFTYATNVVSGVNIQGSGDGWENGASGGFFLFKYVPGNFQMAIHVQSMTVAGFNQPGLLARGYSIFSGVPGYPLGYTVTNANGTNTTREYWVSLARFDEFNIGSYPRRNVDGAVLQSGQTDQGDGNFWLLIVRSGDGSQFDFYKRASATDPWRQVPNLTHYSIVQLAGQPMQVGLMSGPWNGATATTLPVSFDNFMLDITTGSVLKITPDGSGNLIVSWPNVPGTLQHTTTLNPPNWQPVAGTPALGATGYSLTVPGTPGANDFFRLKQ